MSGTTADRATAEYAERHNLVYLPPGYAADLSTMHELIIRGPRSAGSGMRLSSLKNKYPEEYAKLKAEARWQGELL